METQALSTRQVAQALGVSEASVKRWCDAGKIEAAKTAGGHRRLSVGSVVRFLRESGQWAARPEIIGLPRQRSASPRSLRAGLDPIIESLENGQTEAFRSLALQLFVSGHSALEILGECLTPALHEIGRRWECGDLEVYRERRACEMIVSFLGELREYLPRLAENAPRALGGTLGGDPYQVPSAMVATVLREIGWDATALGVGLPAFTFCEAIEKERPRLVWLSVTSLLDEESFVASYHLIRGSALAARVELAIGGQALHSEVIARLEHVSWFSSLAELVEHAGHLAAAR